MVPTNVKTHSGELNPIIATLDLGVTLSFYKDLAKLIASW
jgi:hypothetical protein